MRQRTFPVPFPSFNIKKRRTTATTAAKGNLAGPPRWTFNDVKLRGSVVSNFVDWSAGRGRWPSRILYPLRGAYRFSLLNEQQDFLSPPQRVRPGQPTAIASSRTSRNVHEDQLANGCAFIFFSRAGMDWKALTRI